MPLRRMSISLVLALSFGVVVAVFCAALLVTLFQLHRVTQASELLVTSQQMSLDVTSLRGLAEEYVELQSRFIWRADGNDQDLVNPMQSVAAQMQQEVTALRGRADVTGQRDVVADVADLCVVVEILVDRFNEDVRPLRSVGPLGELDSGDELMRLTALHALSRTELDHMRQLSDTLDAEFAVLTSDAATSAGIAWRTSVRVAQIVFPMALLMGFLAIYYAHQSVVRPITALIEGSKAVALGKFDKRIPHVGSREFRDLAQGFNAMARALAVHQSHLIDAEKLAGVGRIAAGVAHEINNPLAVIIGHVKMLLAMAGDDSDQREELEAIAEESELCRRIVSGLLDLSRPTDATEGEIVNPYEACDEVIGMVQALGLTEGVDMQMSVIDRDLSLRISRGRLRQLSLNILRNALEALKGLRDGRVRIEGYLRARGKLDQAMLADADPDAEIFLVLLFVDNGPGIPEPNLARLFEPFYTTKATGTGLGLSITYNIVRSHGGFIDVETAPAEGTKFTIAIPCTPGESDRAF
jgi:two-component system, NtrC family, sensor kinase